MTGPEPVVNEGVSKARVAYKTSRDLLIGLLAMLLIGLLVLTAVGVWQIRELDAESQQQRDLLVDCTTPGRGCYEEGQRRTGAAVATINEVTIYAAACARAPENDTEAEIRSCIEKHLEG